MNDARWPRDGAPWDDLTLSHLLASGRVDPGRPAVVCEDAIRTYGDVEDRSRRLANGLIGIGIAPGDRVALLAANRVEFLEIEIGVAAAGAVFVPLNWRLRAAEVAAFLRRSRVQAAFVDERLLPMLHALRWSGDLPDLRTIIAVSSEAGDLGYEELCRSASPDPPGHRGRPSDPHEILHTSGTTSDPKGVVWSTETVLYNAHQQITDYRLAPEHSNYVIGDLDGVGGRHDLTWPLLLLGGTVHLKRSGGFDAEQTIRYLAEHRITHVLCVPTVLYDILRTPAVHEHDTGGLRMLLCGGSSVSGTTIARAQECFPSADVVQVYGLTEGGATLTFCPGADAARKPGSAGRPSTNVELRIVDDEGLDLEADVEGEILVRAPTVMPGYWNAPELTAATMAGEWLRTGDIGRLDAEGFLHVSGRSRDVIVTGGTRVYPSEVEDVLLTHPAVADVAVVGGPDERWGEVVCAFVERTPGLRADERELIAYCRERLAGYKKPSTVVFVESMPRTSTGKSRKHLLRELLATERAVP